ncbi:hypothetical protein Scep_028836 [Stephania cephalantha]|uniref:Uncharacterized protein n=1 Tax=Stephania cephalantha TaxID=152367 RepID=A0AAP0EJ33_9MAGN
MMASPNYKVALLVLGMLLATFVFINSSEAAASTTTGNVLAGDLPNQAEVTEGPKLAEEAKQQLPVVNRPARKLGFIADAVGFVFGDTAKFYANAIGL